MAEAGAFLIFLGAITFVTIGAWISADGRRSPQETLLFLAGLGLRQHEAITAMLASALSFLILGLAFAWMP